MYLWILKKIAYRTTQKSLVNKSLRKCYIKSISLFINIRSTNVTERDTLTEETVVVPMVRTCIKRFKHVWNISIRRLFSGLHVLGSDWSMYNVMRFVAFSRLFFGLGWEHYFPHATKNVKIDFLHCLLSKHTLSAPGEKI